MVYLKVVEQSEALLHLARAPGLRSWGVFTGILSIGFGVMFFSDREDSMLWKGFCFLCAVLGAILSLDDWEDCIFNKERDILELKRFSLVERLMHPRGESNTVTALLSHVIDVSVKEDDVKFFGKAKFISLRLKDGFSLPVTMKATKGSTSREHEKLARIIQDFLQIDEKLQAESMLGYSEPDVQEEDEDSSSTSSSDSFEHLTASMTEEISEAKIVQADDD